MLQRRWLDATTSLAAIFVFLISARTTIKARYFSTRLCNRQLFANASNTAVLVFFKSVWAAAFRMDTIGIRTIHVIGRSAAAYAAAENYLQKHQPHITFRSLDVFSLAPDGISDVDLIQ